MQARDAIVAWLEQDDNFLRITAASPFSPSTRRSRTNLRDVLQSESQALNELAAFVNREIPPLNWDAKHAMHMLKHYLMEYRATAEAALSLDDEDAVKMVQHMCRHFQRLQQLHDPIAKKRKGTLAERGPTAETDRNATKEKAAEEEMKNAEGSSQATVGENEVEVVQVNEHKEKKKPRDKSAKKKNAQVEKDAKRKVQAPKMIHGSKEKEGVVSLVTLSSDEEEVDEELPVVRRPQRAKRRAADMTDLTPTPTTQPTRSSTSDEPQDPPVNDENSSLNARGHDKQLNGKKRKNGAKFGSTSKLMQPARNPSYTSPDQAQPKIIQRVGARQRRETSRIAASVPSATQDPGSTRNRSAKSYLSELAEYNSQRQQLLSRREADEDLASPIGLKRQRSLTESDYGLGDIDLPSVDPKPSEPPRSKTSGTPRRCRIESGPSVGILPPLLDRPCTISGKANLERKRVFFNAKRLAFEQLKWYRENEFQQRELDLLRHEMEAREVLAQHELKLKRMQIRADVILPMIVAGASAADIAERLRLL